MSAEDFSVAELCDTVNLTNFMSRAPPSVPDECPVSRAFMLFQHESLPHLPVVNFNGKVLLRFTAFNAVLQTLCTTM